MTESINISLAQINVTVGDIESNTSKIAATLTECAKEHSNLVVFPELTITGYPPEDLVYRETFLQKSMEALERLAAHCTTLDAIIGLPVLNEGKLMNAAAHLSGGKIKGYYYKHRLPNHGVFDEKRYFKKGHDNYCFELCGHRIAIAICEDMWTPTVCHHIQSTQADLIVSINASPFEIDKPIERHNIIQARVKQTSLPIIYTNLVGGQDELVFDGGSFAHTSTGTTALQLPRFKEAISHVQFDGELIEQTVCQKTSSTIEQIHDALVLGIQDYVHKNHFPGALLGLSGGIDSVVTLALACKALGSNNVQAIMMPSRFTSQMSLEDAKAMADILKINYQVLDIEPSYQALYAAVQAELERYPNSTAKENLQARCRGTMLMAVSNASGKIVLTTGNRSEMAVGYATLYGDMAGGFAVLKDLPKTQVYELANFINREQEVIPTRIIDRPPSAELAEDQRDEDSLPPYDLLDRILELYIDHEQDADQIIAKGYDKDIVRRVIRLTQLAEYKRRQAPPGIRIKHKSFGRDRRYPITSGYKN